jgi:uncharacterized coiled-coil DUF342 family protein
MVARSKKFKRSSPLSSMSEAGRAVVEEAQNQLDTWIDENLDRLESEWMESFEKERKAISEEILAIEREIQEARSVMAEALSRLSELEEDWKLGDGASLEQAMISTREAIHRLQSALDERERRLRALVSSLLRAGGLGKP